MDTVTAPLSPSQKGRVEKHARQLLSRGTLRHRDLILLGLLLWECGPNAVVQASYTVLRRLGSMSRGAVADSIARLEAAQLVERIHNFVLVPNWSNGGYQSRRQANGYRVLPVPCHSSAPRTVNQRLKLFSVAGTAPELVKQAQEGLRAVAEASRRRFEAAWQAKRGRGGGLVTP